MEPAAARRRAGPGRPAPAIGETVGGWFLAIGLPADAFFPLALTVSTCLLALLLLPELRAERRLALWLIAQGRFISECALHGGCTYFLDPESFSSPPSRPPLAWWSCFSSAGLSSAPCAL